MISIRIVSIRSLQFLVFALTVINCGAASAQNLIVNGDFQTAIPGGRHPAIPSWSRSDNANGSGESQFDTPTVGCGNLSSQCLQMDAGGAGATVSQTFSTTSGVVYLLNYDADNSTAGQPNAFQAIWGGAPVTGLTLTNTPNVAYLHYQATVVATSSSTTLAFSASAAGNGWFLDNVSVVAQGPPVLTSFSPGSGPAAGATTVVITGTNLTGATGVTFAGTNATSYTVNSDAQITAITAAGSGAGTVVVLNPSGSGISSTNFTYIPPATSFTFTGPTGGALNAASGNFTVTPNSVYTGTITLTPSGGGLSTAIVRTFSNSSAAQTFSITPTAVGPVTLTATNSGSLSNASSLNYATPPSAPSIGTATAGNTSAFVAFTAPVSTGGSTITGYATTCSPGNVTATGASTPIGISGLTNGTAYTCTVTATNAFGASAPSSASNSFTPVVPATSFTFSGPSGGTLNTASGNFTVSPNSVYTGTITITPSGGGLSTAILLNFSNSSAAKVFTITPTAVGPVMLTPSNSGSLTNPLGISFATPPSAPSIGVATAGDGSASVAFTAPLSTGGSAITGYAVTCSSNTSTLAPSSPITVSGLTNGFTYTCAVMATNSSGTGAASGASNSFMPVGSPGAPQGVSAIAGSSQASISFSAPPSDGGAPIANYSVVASPGGFSANGLTSPLTIKGLSNGTAYTFSVTATNSAGSGPSSLSNTVIPVGLPGPPVSVAASAGDGQVTISFAPPVTNGGATITTYRAVSNPGGFVGIGMGTPILVTGLSNGTAYTFVVAATNGAGTGLASSSSNAATPRANSGPPLALGLVSTFPAGILGAEYPLQILSVTGGTGPYVFSISAGSLPPGIVLASPQFGGLPTASGDFPFTLMVSDSTGNVVNAPGSIRINPANADLILSQSNVPFSIALGSQGVPTPASVTIRSSDVQQMLKYSIALSPTVSWLDAVDGGTTPSSIVIALSPAALALVPAVYQTSITMTCLAPSPCAGTTKTVAVSLKVTDPPATISSANSVLSFDAIAGNPAKLSQSIGLQNTGGGHLLMDSASSPDRWISVGPVPPFLAAGPAIPINVTVDPSVVAEGFYNGSVSFSSSAGVITLPVNLRVGLKPLIRLAPSGVQFQTTGGNAPGNSSGSFLVTLEGDSIIRWQASALPGSAWLSVTDSAGSASAASPGVVHFSVDRSVVANLPAQVYYGVIRLSSSDAVNSVIDFEVILEVSPPATSVGPDVYPAGLVFVSGTTATNSSQSVQVSASSRDALPYQASPATQDGGSWLAVSPETGFSSSNAPGQSAVSINAAGLAPGVYRGGISYAFSGAAVRTVNVTLLVLGPVSARLKSAEAPQVSCAPTQLIATQLGLVNNFQQLRGWPVEVALNLITDCGAPFTEAQVSASFSNGDDPLALKPVDEASGNFSGTWTPRSVSSQVTVTSTALGANSLATSAQITGQITANSPPLLIPNGIFHAFWPRIGGPLAPGSAVQMYGSNIALDTNSSTGAPLPVSLGGASVSIGGFPAPLYYVSPEQINAQVPFELAPGNQYEVRVTVNGAISSAESINLVPAAPGIATLASGDAFAQHVDFSSVSASAPAKPGEVVVIYLAGMGATDSFVATGDASPADPLVHPSDSPSVTVNGNPVTVEFAGLTPYYVGLYQIVFQVPANLPDGVATIVVNQSGSLSNSVSLPVKRQD